MATVLFTKENSIYHQLGANCWDKQRNPLNWTGTEPIIAHPPCRAWGDFAWKSKATQEERNLALWALHKVRTNGGILEHPRKSQLWPILKLPTGKNTDVWGGWTLNIDQKWFGHRAIKNTNLYIVGTTRQNIPPIPITYEPTITTIENMTTPERERTPIQLAKWLIQLLEIIEKNKKEQ